MNFLDHTLRIYRLALVLALGWMVAACGGGGSGGGNTGQTSYTRLQPGFFATSVSQIPSYPDAVAILDAGQKWWVVRRESSTAAAIYVGDLTQDGQGGAGVPVLKGFVSGNIRTGSAALTSVSEQGFVSRLSLSADSAAQLPLYTDSFSALRPASTTYSAGLAPDLASLSGTWVGPWIDGLRSSTSASVRINNGVITLPNAVLDCSVSVGSAATLDSNVNLYRVTLVFPSFPNLCARHDQSLAGVLVVYALPNGRRRLELVAVDGSGSGIAFRGEQ